MDEIEKGTGLSQVGLDESSSLSARPEYHAEEYSADPSNAQVFGRTFVSSLYKILKIGSIYEVEHNQTRIAVDEFMSFFGEAMSQYIDDSVSVVIRDELAVVNGESLRLKRKMQGRLNELRHLFASASIKGLLLNRDMTADDFITFLGELRQAGKKKTGMEHVEIPTIGIDHGMPERNIIEAVMNVNKAMYVAHVYVRGLVKLKNAHELVRTTGDADVPAGVIRRIMQSISELIGDEDFTILGLLPLRIVPPDLSTHSFNSAIYAMIIGDRLGLPPQLTSFIGMTTIYQDIDRLVGVTVEHRDKTESNDPIRQFSMNLRDIARMLPRVKGDIVSTLRILLTYERGCLFEKPLVEPFYKRPRNLHLAPRIVDLCRTYDLLIQGLEGYKSRRPDIAIQYIENRAEQSFDKALVDLMVSTLGVYPIGTTVQLSSGEKAVVIRTPEPARDPRRPVVRILNTRNPMTINLADDRHTNIQISGSIEIDPAEITVSKLFLLS